MPTACKTITIVLLLLDIRLLISTVYRPEQSNAGVVNARHNPLCQYRHYFSSQNYGHRPTTDREPHVLGTTGAVCLPVLYGHVRSYISRGPYGCGSVHPDCRFQHRPAIPPGRQPSPTRQPPRGSPRHDPEHGSRQATVSPPFLFFITNSETTTTARAAERQQVDQGPHQRRETRAGSSGTPATTTGPASRIDRRYRPAGNHHRENNPDIPGIIRQATITQPSLFCTTSSETAPAARAAERQKTDQGPHQRRKAVAGSSGTPAMTTGPATSIDRQYRQAGSHHQPGDRQEDHPATIRTTAADRPPSTRPFSFSSPAAKPPQRPGQPNGRRRTKARIKEGKR